MEQALAGKVVLITGGARRVGAAITRRLHAAGANVVIHYNTSATEASALRDSLNASRRDSAIAVSCDLLDVSVLDGLVHSTIARFGRLDVLINNASTFYATPVGSYHTGAVG